MRRFHRGIIIAIKMEASPSSGRAYTASQVHSCLDAIFSACCIEQGSPMAPPYIQSEPDSIPLAVPGSRAACGDGVVGSEPLTLAVPGSRAADGEGTAHIYMQWLRHTYSSACTYNCCRMEHSFFPPRNCCAAQASVAAVAMPSVIWDDAARIIFPWPHDGGSAPPWSRG